MVRHPRPFTRRLIAALALVLGTARTAAEPPEPTPASAPVPDDSPRINIFLNAPADLEAVWKSLQQPDFILLRGGELSRMLERAGGTTPAPAPAPPVVDSVAVEGTVGDDRADLAVELGITLAGEGPVWVPIRLDDQTVTDAREGDRLLPLRVVGSGWQVELRGKGAHAVRVDLKARPKPTADGRRLGLAIPEAASTRFAWEVAQRVGEATAGPNDPVDVEPVAGSSRTRLAAHLTPRPRLDVVWRVEAESRAQLPTLLSIQGEIAIDVAPGSFRTLSTWSIRSIRESPRSLELVLNSDDEVLDLKLDGQDMPAGIGKVNGESRLTIALPEPLRPGATRSLVMTTRRPIPANGPPALTFRGFPLRNAREQSGAIGIAQNGNFSVAGTPERGLRRIDPRTELPADLRARPGTVLAYQFFDQPFELSLRVDASPPLVRTEDRTTVTLDASQARIETWLDYQTANGRLFDVRVGLPRGLELESVGPKEFVESSQLIAEPAGARPGAAPGEGGRALTIRLTPKAQEGGVFSLHLTGRQAIDPSRPVAVALFQPRGTTSRGGRVAVLADRNLTVDLRDRADAAGGLDEFRPAVVEPPGDWPWPAPRPASAEPPALWLRHDGSPPRLPLEVAVHRRTVTSESVLLVQVDRRGVEVEQDTEVAIHFGTMDHLDLEVPAALRESWELERGSVARRDDLGGDARGNRRYRLRLADEVAHRVKLRFRYRLPAAPRLTADRPVEIAIPWLKVAGEAEAPVRATIAADPSIGLDVAGAGWARAGDDGSAVAIGESELTARLVLASAAGKPPAPLRVLATAHPLTPLPTLVAPRLWLRTVEGPEGELRVTASYWVETHAGALSVALPAGSEWARAKVAGEAVAQVEALPKGEGHRIVFPAHLASGPVTVELEYTLRGAGTPWAPPRLLGYGLVQQTLWEVRIPVSRALVGVPPGWSDENEWYWDRYVFKRRPWRNAAALAAWASGSPSRAKGGDDPDEDARGEGHSYLFGRPGPPTELRPFIASRAWLVAACSGSVLAVGAFLILFWRPSVRLAWVAALALVLAGATAVSPSVTFLAIQSAMIGVACTLLTALMDRLVHRRRRPAVFGEPSGLGVSTGPGSSLSQPLGVGSDDSTAVRVRPSSIVDHVATNPVAPVEGATGRSSRVERSG